MGPFGGLRVVRAFLATTVREPQHSPDDLPGTGASDLTRLWVRLPSSKAPNRMVAVLEITLSHIYSTRRPLPKTICENRGNGDEHTCPRAVSTAPQSSLAAGSRCRTSTRRGSLRRTSIPSLALGATQPAALLLTCIQQDQRVGLQDGSITTVSLVVKASKHYHTLLAGGLWPVPIRSGTS